MSEIVDQLIGAFTKIRQAGLIQDEDGILSVRDKVSENIFLLKKGFDPASIRTEDVIIISLSGELLQGVPEDRDERIYTHLVLYRAYPFIGSVCQFNTHYCSLFASCQEGIPPLSVDHAKYFFGEIPCTKPIDGDYRPKERCHSIGQKILMAFGNRFLTHVQACLIAAHGGIAWGTNAATAAENFIALEKVAHRAWECGLRMQDQWKYIPYELNKNIFFEHHPEIEFLAKPQYIEQELPKEVFP